jgi:hypothetical protein
MTPKNIGIAATPPAATRNTPPKPKKKGTLPQLF